MSTKRPPRPNNDPDILSPQQLKFVTEYLRNGRNGKAAAIAAGYSAKNAAKQACLLLKTSRKIKEFMSIATREASLEVGVFSIQAAMREADEAIAFAKATNNANAWGKILELKMKLHGLLIERHDIKSVAPFSFTILPFGVPAPTAPAAIDVTPAVSLPAPYVPTPEPTPEKENE